MNPRSLVTIAVACVAAAATTLILPGRPAASWHATFSPSLVEPSGAEDVGVRCARVDSGADDPWHPGQERVVMVDIRYPATDGEHPLRYYGRSQHMSEFDYGVFFMPFPVWGPLLGFAVYAYWLRRTAENPSPCVSAPQLEVEP